MPDLSVPEVQRVSFLDCLEAALADLSPDVEYRTRLAAAARILAPLPAMQIALDDLIRALADRRAGAIDPYGRPATMFVREAMVHLSYQRDILKAAHLAAEGMIGQLEERLTQPESKAETSAESSPVVPPKSPAAPRPEPELSSRRR